MIRPARSDDPARVEGGGDVADLEAAVATRCDRDDVEPTVGLRDVHPLEIVLCQTDEPPSLPPRHGGAGPVVPAFLPALHFDEDPDFAVTAYEIDLTLAELDVPRDDAQTEPLQEARRGALRRAPENLSGTAPAPGRERGVA